ncbi:deaminase [Catellatospora methionotrophica]|uniref:Deaminase n=1 Tax=Catellatospora methionotrophica TaxID=121620 RepID=A0A8J3LC32_9ACTN|nr:dihydrofolate reductase family protein [Catellatospora methionotrophica]GIG18177.1 deaminase [Catellatospora methionotrophica]
MRKLTYYISATLDGYIAGPGGEYDFFPFEGEPAAAILAEYPETMPTPARVPLGVADRPARHFDAVIMGRGTYDPGLAVGLTSPYGHLEQYVVSRTLTGVDPAVTFVADDPVGVVRDLKQRDGLGIWLAGGGRLAGVLLDEIDELIIKRHPIVLGAGIALFAGPHAPVSFTRTGEVSFDNGFTITSYAKAAA